MLVRSVLLVVKKTGLAHYAHERRDPKLLKALDENHPFVDRLRRSDAATRDAVAAVCAALAERGIRYETSRASPKRSAARHQLVISVGGDGTLLDACRGVVDQAVFAVNSFPETSVGHFCGATVETFAERLDRILAHDVEPTQLQRIAVELDGRLLHYPALNDILLAHLNPAAATRYLIRVEDEEEEHLSSGVWVSTAAGSTAAIRAAGGVRQPIQSTDLQYLVRELYRPPGRDLRLEGGILSEPLELVSKLYDGGVFMDGHRHRFRVGFGDHILVRPHEHPLRLYLFDRRGRPHRDATPGHRARR